MIQHTIARSLSTLLKFADSRPRGTALKYAQSRILVRLLNHLSPLPVGQHFQLDKIPRNNRCIYTFRNSIPETNYHDYAPFIERIVRGEANVLFPGKAVALAQTSGTTSHDHAGERYIPQSKSLLQHHARGGAAALSRLIQKTGGHLFNGQMLMLGGSTDLTRNESGIPVGDLSGIITSRIPFYLQSLYEPGIDIALENNWERKLDRIAERCSDKNITLVSGIPAWLLMLFERICQKRGLSRARIAWPNLNGFIHGGHAITPFLPSLNEHLSPQTEMLEVYPASEAFIAVGSRTWQLHEREAPPLELLANNGVYFEFAPLDGGPTVGAEELEIGMHYRLLITTPGGLIRYQIGDVVEGAGPGCIRVAGRIKTRISVFGEHVEGIHLDQALATACHITHTRVAYYHVAPLLPNRANAAGGHEWFVEFIGAPPSPTQFVKIIDHYLRAHVIDYDAHRAAGQLIEPRLTALPTGSFHHYLANNGKLGGQHKVPQAWNDRRIAEQLLNANKELHLTH